MRNAMVFISLLALVLGSLSCEGPTGPAGPPGDPMGIAQRPLNLAEGDLLIPRREHDGAIP